MVALALVGSEERGNLRIEQRKKGLDLVLFEPVTTFLKWDCKTSQACLMYLMRSVSVYLIIPLQVKRLCYHIYYM
jgi:hypothetical protein